MLRLWVRLGRGCAEVHHGTVLKTLLLLLSVVTGLHRILGQNSFFFFLTDAIASFIGHYGVAQDSRSEFYFFFCNGHYCFRYRLLRGCGGFWVKILFLKKMVPQSNSTGYQFSLTRIASGQYISSFSTGSEQRKRWINKDGKLIKVLDITEA